MMRCGNKGAVWKCRFSNIAIPIIKISRSWYRFLRRMEIPIAWEEVSMLKRRPVLVAVARPFMCMCNKRMHGEQCVCIEYEYHTKSKIAFHFHGKYVQHLLVGVCEALIYVGRFLHKVVFLHSFRCQEITHVLDRIVHQAFSILSDLKILEAYFTNSLPV